MAERKRMVFNTRAEAREANRKMMVWMKRQAGRDGYTVIDGPDGGIVGKRNGVDAPDAQLTTGWDRPRQRKDGKFVIQHPEYHTRIRGDGTRRAEMMAEVGTAVEEDEPDDDSWFDR